MKSKEWARQTVSMEGAQLAAAQRGQRLSRFGGLDEDEGMPAALIDYLNEAQNSIDCWIKEGGNQQHAQPSVAA